MPEALETYAQTVPFNALRAFGFGPLARADKDPQPYLAQLRAGEEGLWGAFETAGVLGRQIVFCMAALGGEVTTADLEFQTQNANPEVIRHEVERLKQAKLILAQKGGLKLATPLRTLIGESSRSMAATGAIDSDRLAAICRVLGLPGATRKQDRIDAISQLFRDPTRGGQAISELRASAQTLLQRIAAAAGMNTTSPLDVGLSSSDLQHVAVARYGRQIPVAGSAADLYELTRRGLVGVDEWHGLLWIWAEAWPALNRPIFAKWPSVPEPAVVRSDVAASRLPLVVGLLEQAIALWQSNPPATLKSDEPRLAKPEIRATARSLGAGEAAVDLASRLAISIGLLLSNTVGVSGRGRNRRVNAVWRPDPNLLDAWNAVPPLRRWLRLFAEWCAPATPGHQQLLANRHLLLWELGRLAEGTAFADGEELAEWIGFLYAPVAHPDAIRECIVDLRLMGAATEGPLSLTVLARTAIDDPASVGAMGDDAPTSAVVQADLTIIAPPDLRDDLVATLHTIADLRAPPVRLCSGSTPSASVGLFKLAGRPKTS